MVGRLRTGKPISTSGPGLPSSTEIYHAIGLRRRRPNPVPQNGYAEMAATLHRLGDNANHIRGGGCIDHGHKLHHQQRWGSIGLNRNIRSNFLSRAGTPFSDS